MEFLPSHMFAQVIFPKFDLVDLIKFSAVCKSWEKIAVENQSILTQIPWLMISRDEETNTGTFISPSESNKIYQLNLPPLVASTKSFCLGSSRGYLMTSRSDGCIKFFNLFSQKEINYPRCYVRPTDMFSTINPQFYFKGVSILPSPSSEFIIAGINNDYKSIVEICKPCDEEWSVFGAEREVTIKYFNGLPDSEDDSSSDEEIYVDEVVPEERCITNILFYKGKLHGLTRTNGIVQFAIEDPDKQHISYDVLNVMPMSTPPEDEIFNKFATYLVESCGELLLVYRFYKKVLDKRIANFVTGKFLVYKLVEQVTNRFLQWVAVDNLEDQMLFLGLNSSLSISAKGIPHFKGNCIYFTDDLWSYHVHGNGDDHVFSDNGIFYLADGRVESFFDAGAATSDWNTKPFNYHFLWVQPNTLLGR